jgi:NADPH2:quinone reductase
MNKVMKSIQVHETGGVEQLKYEDQPIPTPAGDEVLIRVEASGVNFIDTYQRRGWYELDCPFGLGIEAAGVVQSVGNSVKDFKKGDRVAGFKTQGSYAEYAVYPQHLVVHLPDAISSDVAASVMIQATTAHYLSHSTYRLEKGDTALVHAAAGGTGALLVQMAKLRGAKVIATVGSRQKAEIAKAAGADRVVIYTEDDFEPVVDDFTSGRGCDVVYDSVGKSTFEKGLNCLSERGFMVLFGQSSGPIGQFDPQILNQKGSLYLTRPSLFSYIQTRTELESRVNDIFAWIEQDRLKVRIDKKFALKDAADAHSYIESRKSIGKVLLTP